MNERSSPSVDAPGAAASMPRWIVTRRGLLRAVRPVEIDGESLMIYRADDRRHVFRIAGTGCGHLEEVTDGRRERALTAAGCG